MKRNIINEAKNKYLRGVSDRKILSASKKMKLFIEIYNKLCGSCKSKISKNPALPYENYCDKCKEMINECSSK